MRAGIGWLLPLLLLAGCMNAIPQPRAAPAPRTPTQHTAPPVSRRPTQRTAPRARLAPPPPPAFRAPQVQQLPEIAGLIGQNAAGLVRQFGDPRLDVHEGDMRKLQFTGQACVLDVFLYPLQQGAEPVATYVEARRASDGQEVDKASCVEALLRR